MENIQPTCTIGDLVMIRKYGNMIWQVNSLSSKRTNINGVNKHKIAYSLKSVASRESILAQQEEVILVCKASYAKEYLQKLDKNGYPPTNDSSKSSSTRTVKFKNSKEMDDLLIEYSKILSARDLLEEMTDGLRKMLHQCEEEMIRVKGK